MATKKNDIVKYLPWMLFGGLLLLPKRTALTKSYLGLQYLPRGMRNNNPGNLVRTSIPWLGKLPADQNTDSRFEQFKYYWQGVRAMIKDLINDIGKGKNTIEALIYEYAPPLENRTENYIEAISKKIGVNRSAPLVANKDTLRALAQAIAEIENAPKLNVITDSDFSAAWQRV